MEPNTRKAYEAFRVQPIIESLPGHQRVESICCWNGYLLVGLQDGTIVQCSALRNEGAWQVVKAHRSLERKSVVQMEAIRLTARPLLLALKDDGVNLLTLPDMQLKFQPMGSRGASLFAWQEEAQMLAVAVRRRIILYQLKGSELLDAGERPAPDVVSAMLWVGPGTLLVGMRRQYIMLNTVTGAVVDVETTGSAPHPLAQLCAGGQELLLTRDSSTYFHSTADGRYTRRRHLIWSEPLQALVTAGQYAVAVTASGLEVRSLRRVAEGHVVQRVPLGEPSRPVAPAVSQDGAVFVAAGPLAASTTAVAAAVASASGGGAGTGTPSGAAAAAATPVTSSSIYRLVPVPLEEQAHTLAELGEYGEALALAALVDEEEEEGEQGDGGAGVCVEGKDGGPMPADDAAPGPRGSGGSGAEAEGSQVKGRGGREGRVRTGSSRRALLEERLRLAYGHYLFQSGEYDEGMAQLALCKCTTALVLLRLFPSLVPAKFKHYLPTKAAGQPLPDVPEPVGGAYVTAVSQLLPYIMSHRTRAITALAEQEAAAAEQQQQDKAKAGDLGDAVGSAARVELPFGIKGRSDTKGSANGGQTFSGTTADGSTPPRASQLSRPASAVANGQASLPSASAASAASAQKAAARDAASPAPSGGAAGGNAVQQHSGFGDCAMDAPPPAPPPRELLSVLDTAIVRIMTFMPDTGALLRFVQLANYVDLQEGEAALSGCGMYAELAALYKYNGCHEQGLELLRKLSQEPSALPQKARGAAADLPGLPGVWAAVRYIVCLSAEQAAIIQRHAGWILAADPEAGLSALLHMRPPLHPSLALSILNQHSRHYCGLYLETALQIGVALPQDYHNELLLIYLRDILAKETLSPSRASNQSGDELKELLLSHRPDPDQPPLLFPEDLTHALLNNPPPGAGSAARRFASAPASSAGTPSGLSRVPSQVSLQGGQGGKAAGALRGTRSSGTAAMGAKVRPRGGSVASQAPSSSSEEESSESSSVEEEAEGSHGAGKEGSAAGVMRRTSRPAGSRTPPPGPGKGAPTQATEAGVGTRAWATASAGGSASGTPVAGTLAARPSRRQGPPRRSSARSLDAGGKPPLPPSADQEAASTAPASPQVGPEAQAAAASAAAAAAAGPSLYQRLRDLVYTSPYIDPGYVLDKLPAGELLEIRALMLERLGAHREALRLYVHALRDLAAAEAYCDRVYSATVVAAAGAGAAAPYTGPPGAAANAGPVPLAAGVLVDLSRPGDIYLELVQALFDGPESCPSAAAVAAAAAPGWPPSREAEGGAKLDPATWQALSRILSRKRERLDPMQVLSLLPDGVAVADVLPWLESALRYTVESRRNLAVIKQLRRSENLSAMEDAVRVRQHRIVVTSERACSLCHKRMGGAVFVSYPGGLLAHYLCHKRHTEGAEGGVVTEMGGGYGSSAGTSLSLSVVELQHGATRSVRGQSGGGGAEVPAWA